MLVYRVAHPKHFIEGQPAGPYVYGNWPSEPWTHEMGEAHRDDGHPVPWRDGYSCRKDEEFCAFESMMALNQWFEGWTEKLHESGYLVHVYDVPDEHVRTGGIQVLAEIRCGSLVRTEPCS
jgi:hypothetical protein